jgi:hypothetical protein
MWSPLVDETPALRAYGERMWNRGQADRRAAVETIFGVLAQGWEPPGERSSRSREPELPQAPGIDGLTV